ncbi:hypothetical protein ACFHYQ_01365 [Sphaerimonospora cavernae]|uniref:XRE family transcriptional regulator n=1 Tax=Sphaerimonospora cavernae TaxID=1740611 RepID=A0ABV6TZB7_9ACTN
MEPTPASFARFPVVARPRPACAPLDARVSRLCELARTADRDDDQTTASAVFNQAALLASDLDLPDLAREWCHRHADLYLRARPLTGRAAQHALEPLVNLARLHIRAGDGDTAFRLLDSLYEALAARTDTVIEGIQVPASELTPTDGDHREVLRWLWTVHLADGTRALTTAGRWQDALNHLRHRNGIGQRMLDGRQVAVIAHATADDVGTARALLAGTEPGEPWEDAVTACLAALCEPRRTQGEALDVMLNRYRRIDQTTSGLVVFRTRLGLSVIDAAGGVGRSEGRAVAVTLITGAVASADGYAARELLDHPGCAALLESEQATALTRVLQASALGRRRLPERLMAKLSAALDMSDTVITRTLGAAPKGAERA